MNVVQYERVGTLKDGEVFEWSIPGWILNHQYSTKRSDLFSHVNFPDFRFCLTLWPYPNSKASAAFQPKSVSFNLQLHRIPVFECGSGSSAETFGGVLQEIDVRFILYKLNSIHKWSCSMKLEDKLISADFPEVTNYDSLTIQCIMMCSRALQESEVIPSAGTTGDQNASDDCHPLVDDMEALLSSTNHSDVTLCVDDKEFNVHRCILASRSEVFAAMFKYDTQEKLQNRIVIVDVPSDVISLVLKYVYTNKLDELSPEQYLSLFSAADKYALLDLWKKCSQRLQKNLPLHVLMQVLVAADLHQDEDLKNAVVQKFLKNAVSVMSSDEWLPFLKNHAELASSMLMHLAEKSSVFQTPKS